MWRSHTHQSPTQPIRHGDARESIPDPKQPVRLGLPMFPYGLAKEEKMAPRSHARRRQFPDIAPLISPLHFGAIWSTKTARFPVGKWNKSENWFLYSNGFPPPVRFCVHAHLLLALPSGTHWTNGPGNLFIHLSGSSTRKNLRHL